MATGNKRVSQLVELTSEEIQPNDLFLIIDATARESKKIKASELDIWLHGSGSVVVTAETASYILGTNVAGAVALANYAYSASTALLANSASWSPFSISSSYALTASYALVASGSGGSSASSSYLIYVGSPNGTASYAIQSLTSFFSNTASYLSYFGGNNGTASYAISAGNVNRAKYSDTASYFLSGPGASVATASYAFVAEVANSGTSDSSSYLIYSPNNGTASYAMSAKTFANIITDKGIFLADTQSYIKSQLDGVDVLWSTFGNARTPIEAVGTVIVPFTSSAPTNGTLYLAALDINTGLETIFDSTPIYFNISPTVGTYGNYNSGSVKQMFSLMGQSNLYGTYMVYVSASNNLQLDSARTVRFNIASETDTFDVYSTNVPIQFSSYPTSSLFTFTSNIGGPFVGSAYEIATSASVGNQIYTIDGINNGTVTMNYLWTLTHLTASNFSNNFSLVTLSGIPNSLTYLSCSYCNLSSFYTFESSSLSILSCDNNVLMELPNFPVSMSQINCTNNLLTSINLPVTLSYLNCSYNNITTLPDPTPYGLTTLLANYNQLSTLPINLTDTIVSMSMNNNPLGNFSMIPTSSLYLSFNNCIIDTLPSLPGGIQYLSMQSCSLYGSSIDDITDTLVLNAVLSGTIDVRGNGTLGFTSTANMLVLSCSYGWTTLYDL
jgi:hypothetical protein